MTMTIEEILKQINSDAESFPRDALIEAIANREEITHELLKIIKFAHENMHTLIEKQGYYAHLCAIYLLAQFREKDAYKLIVDFFSVPGEISLDFTGDLVTENLGRILASVCHGDIALIKGLIENERINQYVRSAAIEALSILVVIGETKREEIIYYFKELFNGKLERHSSNVWNVLVVRSVRLYAEELYGEIKKAFDDDLVEPLFITFQEFKDTFKRDKDEVINELKDRRRWRLVEDAVEDLEKWNFVLPPIWRGRISSPFNHSAVPYIRETKKIGRNEPCPCGSGEKYKKCCLKKT